MSKIRAPVNKAFPKKDVIGKRPGINRTRFSVSLMPGTVEYLSVLADASRRNRSQMVQVMLDEGIERRRIELGLK